MKRALALLLSMAACSAHAPPPKIERAGLESAWEGAPVAAGDAVEAAWWRAFHDPVLDELVAMAERRNLDVRLAAARVREARALRLGARAAQFPTLDVSGQITTGLQRGATDRVTTGADLVGEVSWEADVFGRLRGEARAAGADLAAAAADHDAVRIAVAAEISRSYVEYRLFQMQRDLAEKNTQAQEATLRIARSRLAQGMASRLDVDRIEAVTAATRAQVAQSDELAETARHRMVLLGATTPDELSRVVPAVGPLPQADAVTVLLTPTQVIARRPDVRAAERRLVAAAARLDTAAALRWPRLTLGGAFGIGADDLETGGGLLWNVAAGLLAPIFDFGRIRATIDAADARQEQAYLAYELVARAALGEVQTAIVLYARGLTAQRDLTAAMEAARRAAGLARRQYAEGTLSLLEVLDAERTVYQNELEWARGTAEVSFRVIRLYQTMGVLPPLALPRA